MSKYLSSIISLSLILILFFVLTVSFLPQVSSAAPTLPNGASSYVPPTDGLVTCGRGAAGPMSCTLAELLKLIDNVLLFFMYAIVFPVTIFLIIYAGGKMIYYGNTNPGKASEAKKIFYDILIGFAIIFSAYVVVHQVFGYFLGTTTTGPVKQAIDQVFGPN
ncbi:MAG: hypothetical protein WCV68_03325 [Candidatus Paceibacterota bacterium]|jgi:hypothetical protein